MQDYQTSLPIECERNVNLFHPNPVETQTFVKHFCEVNFLLNTIMGND